MPFLQFYTTLSAARIAKDFQRKTAVLLNQILKDKPLDRIAVHLVPDQIIFSGNDLEDTEPKAYAVLRRVGSMSAEDNKKTRMELAKHAEKELGIKDSQFRLFIIDLDPNFTALKDLSSQFK